MQGHQPRLSRRPVALLDRLQEKRGVRICFQPIYIRSQQSAPRQSRYRSDLGEIRLATVPIHPPICCLRTRSAERRFSARARSRCPRPVRRKGLEDPVASSHATPESGRAISLKFGLDNSSDIQWEQTLSHLFHAQRSGGQGSKKFGFIFRLLKPSRPFRAV